MAKKLDNDLYEAEMTRLQAELVEMQEWVRATGARVVVLFEGRDAAGKGGAIKRITEYLNPRVCRVVALPAPTERQTTQWYFQRYVEHLPAAGEIRLFDRSWYNRAGVEKVMGYCTPAQHQLFLRQAPIFERMLMEDGILLRKYWFSVSDHEQEKRFKSRMTDPMRRWKLSPTDLESLTRWEDYSRAKDEMFVHTDLPECRWNVVEAEDKKRARINMISHLLQSIPYEHVPTRDRVPQAQQGPQLRTLRLLAAERRPRSRRPARQASPARGLRRPGGPGRARRRFEEEGQGLTLRPGRRPCAPPAG